MFDFANSGYTTVVITAIFNAYFVGVVTNNEDWGTFAWTASLAVSYALIIVAAPLLGAYADAYAAKKRLLLLRLLDAFIYRAALFCRPRRSRVGNFSDCSVKFFFRLRRKSNCCIFAGTGSEQALGKVSGWGWSLGYIGGLVSSGRIAGYVTWAQNMGMRADQFVPVTMLITAVIFSVACIPTFLFLKNAPYLNRIFSEAARCVK